MLDWIPLKSKIQRIFPNISAIEMILKQPIRIAAILLFSYYAGKYLGRLILLGQYLVPAVIFIGFLFLLLSSKKQKFFLLSATVFLPFQFSRFFVNQMKWNDLLSLMFCFFMILDLLINKKKIFNKEIKIYYVAIGIISSWSLIHFVNNPVLGGFFGESVDNSGIRSYFMIVVGIALFFYSFWYFRDRINETNRLISFFMILSLVFGYLSLAGYFIGFRIPFLGDVFAFGRDENTKFYRIGGLSEMSLLGVSSVLTLYNQHKWKAKQILLLVSFVVLMFFSGARGGFMGMLLMLLVYVLFINRRYFLPTVISIIIVASSYFIFLEKIELPNQIKRLTAIEGEAVKKERFRSIGYEFLIKQFIGNPIFGKGFGLAGTLSRGVMDTISHEDLALQNKAEDRGEIKASGKRRTRTTLTDRDITILASYRGGHGSYVSIIGIYGSGGIIYFFIMLYGSIYFAFKIYMGRLHFDIESKLALFAFLYLVSMTLFLVAGGSGYDIIPLWFLPGMVAALKTRSEGNNEQDE